ncbi:hypothetical protein BGZ72_005874 [Mortierella alpina]|nr:hypothetical protein BGZ72_005874 [Mortierella alpina]
MLSKMAIDRKIHRLDCIALDGGYTQHLDGIIAGSEQITSANFSCPIRKRRGIELTDDEDKYNAVFGSFRSKIESYFGDMQTTFAKFSHAVVIRVTEKNVFALQYKICCLLMNIKRMVALRNITTDAHHSFWNQDNYDYPNDTDNLFSTQPAGPSYRIKINDARAIFRLQDAFLNLSVNASTIDHDMDSDDDAVYEIDKILGHRGEGEALEYHALKTNSTLATLNLYNNSIGSDGAKALAEALKTNSTLATLDLQRNSIRDDGAKALAEALKINSTVTIRR